MFKKSLIGIILFSVITTLLLQIDDDLNPEVATLLEQAKPAEHSEAYLYLLGIVATEGEDPLTVGKQLFTLIQQAEKNYTFGDESFDYQGYPEDKKLALPQGELFCSGWDDGCWQSIFSNEYDIDQTLKTHALLLERYHVFLKMDDYRSLSRPILLETFPAFHYLLKANRLVILSSIKTKQTSILINTIAALRQNLKRADNLIGKMIYSALISDNLDALFLIAHQEKSTLKDKIPSLLQSERDFGSAMPRELALSYDIGAGLEKDTDFFSSANMGVNISTPSWMVKPLFKPNMSLNHVGDFHKKVIARSQLTPIEFASAVLDDDKRLRTKPSYLSYIRNPIGFILNDVASPSFDQYIAKLFDLNAKVAIFNQTTNKVELPADLDYIQNPYYETGGTAYYSKDGRSICLTGPLENDKNQRCLRVKL